MQQINKIKIENDKLKMLSFNIINNFMLNITKEETIEHKGKTYILDDNKVYKMNEDGSKDILYGTFIDGKVKKLKSNDEKEV